MRTRDLERQLAAAISGAEACADNIRELGPHPIIEQNLRVWRGKIADLTVALQAAELRREERERRRADRVED